MILDYIAQYGLLTGNKAEGEEDIKQVRQNEFDHL